MQILPSGRVARLSAENVGDLSRLEKHRVPVVDPLDRWRGFVAGIPTSFASKGIVKDGQALAGDPRNFASVEGFLGLLETSITVNGSRAHVHHLRGSEGAPVLASRSKVSRDEWERFRNAVFLDTPLGSVEYKSVCVATGLANATCSLAPKHKWEVATDVAPMLATGSVVRTLPGRLPVFDRPGPCVNGFVAFSVVRERSLESHSEIAGGQHRLPCRKLLFFLSPPNP